MAYQSQSVSLRSVQQFGPQLEAEIRKFLGWPNGSLTYFKINGWTYEVQVDGCWPNLTNPKAFLSVTYCSPDKPGHSNENKLQLKLGEVLLFKARYPELRSVLVVGGNQGTWLPYVLRAFQYFFDLVIFSWEDDAEKQLQEVKANPAGIPLKHQHVWAALAKEWAARDLWKGAPINSSLRQGIWELASETGVEGMRPSDISNPIMRLCMQAAYNQFFATKGKNGVEWTHYMNQDWDKLWQSRSFFNPGEAAIKLTLEQSKLAHLGSLAVDAPVPSMLNWLSGNAVLRIKSSEDFVLFSRALNRPVFIQSKSTGGGLEGHGKNIQNRTKEQLSRSLIYRGSVSPDGEVHLREQDFVWIGLLDGNWGVTKNTPLKYLHMLQWAGYQYLLPADGLVDDRYDLLPENANPLAKILKDLDCSSDQDELEVTWREWFSQRVPAGQANQATQMELEEDD